jgi:type I restriction enzyme, R subunit
MARNERLTCEELIEPRLAAVGWSWQVRLLLHQGRLARVRIGKREDAWPG